MKYTPSSGTVWLHVEPYFWERRTVQRPPLVERRKERMHRSQLLPHFRVRHRSGNRA